MQQRDRHASDDSRSRRGAAVVELAICLPILVLIFLATIDACVMLQVKQNVAITAYEGARIGIIPGAANETVQQQCQMLLDDRAITGYTITTNPSDLSSLNTGDLLTVTVTANCMDNTVVGGAFFENKRISESVVMKAE